MCVCMYMRNNKNAYQLGSEALWRDLREGIWEGGGNVILSKLEHFKKRKLIFVVDKVMSFPDLFSKKDWIAALL